MLYRSDKLIGVLAQRDANIEELMYKDLCQIGTVAKLLSW